MGVPHGGVSVGGLAGVRRVGIVVTVALTPVGVPWSVVAVAAAWVLLSAKQTIAM